MKNILGLVTLILMLNGCISHEYLCEVISSENGEYSALVLGTNKVLNEIPPASNGSYQTGDKIHVTTKNRFSNPKSSKIYCTTAFGHCYPRRSHTKLHYIKPSLNNAGEQIEHVLNGTSYLLSETCPREMSSPCPNQEQLIWIPNVGVPLDTEFLVHFLLNPQNEFHITNGHLLVLEMSIQDHNH